MRVSYKLNFKLTCVKLSFKFNRKQFSKYLNSDFVEMLLIGTIVDNETVYGQTDLALDHWFLQSHGSDMPLPKIRNFQHEKQKSFPLVVNKRILPDFHSEGNYDLLLVLQTLTLKLKTIVNL